MVDDKYKFWLEKTKNDEVLHEDLLKISGLPDEINDRFYKELSFGTAGLRGKLGAGTNRMNVYTVARATAGFADYILSVGKNSVCIAYDSRNMSDVFARLAAEIMSSKDIKVYLFDKLMPTPVLSFAVRKLRAGAGIVVTASHNPKEYNGYKVYNSNGCQATDGEAGKITEFIDKHDYFEDFKPKNELIGYIGDEILDDFIEAIYKYSLPFDKKYMPSIVYTPLNGTGLIPVEKIFKKIGITDYTVVPEQKYPDGNFPTCPYPNPEFKEALAKAIETAGKTKAELIIASDPDADRTGVAFREENGEYRLLSGNEAGSLLVYFILATKKARSAIPDNAFIVSTVVTSPLPEKIAESFGVETINVLTGFKYIGEAIDKNPDKNFVFGMEESIGYLVGAHARDKDSVSATMMFAEAACYYKSLGLSLSAALGFLYRKYGYYRSALYAKYFEGEQGMIFMTDLMDKLRKNPFGEICGKTVTEIKDYSLGLDGLPKSNVLVFKGNEFSLIARPSGTEPKLKFYLTAWDSDEKSSAEFVEKMTEFVKTLV
ncbi:MAG: phospho-sugar mutase [Clostridiales bacterium]|nr:phospho-sugar mutase [Clostridiales bacterium]